MNNHIKLKENTTYLTRSGEKVHIVKELFDLFYGRSGVTVGGAVMPMWAESGRFESFFNKAKSVSCHDIVSEVKKHKVVTLELSEQDCKILQYVLSWVSGYPEGPRGSIDRIINQIEIATEYTMETAEEENIIISNYEHSSRSDVNLVAGKNYVKG
jgi:hypothetical protein